MPLPDPPNVNFPKQQGARDKHGRNKKRKNLHANERKDRQVDKTSDNHDDRNGKSEVRKKGNDVEASQTSKPVAALSPAKSVRDDTDNSHKNSEDWEWEFDAIFKEPVTIHEPDEIGKPLPSPADYHEDVMLPPPWNASCVESEFVNIDNMAEFSRPIRETSFFEAMQDDPVFWKDGKRPPPVPPKRKEKTPAEILAGPFPSMETGSGRSSRNKRTREESAHGHDEDNRRPQKRRHSSDRYDQTRHYPHGGPREQGQHGGYHHKRYSTEYGHSRRASGPFSPGDTRHNVADRRPSYSSDPDPARTLLDSLDRQEGNGNDTGPRRRYQESRRNSSRDRSRMHRSRHGSTPSLAHPHLKSSSESRPPSRRSSRCSSPESRPSSRQSCASFGTDDSDLSSVEAAILGRPHRSKDERGKDNTRSGKKTARPKRRPAPKLNDVYR